MVGERTRAWGVPVMVWIVTALLVLIGVVWQVIENGPSFLLTFGGVSSVIALGRIIYDNWAIVHRSVKRLWLWILNVPLEWEIRALLTCAQESDRPRARELLDLLGVTLQRHPKYKSRHRDFTILGEPTQWGIGAHQKALGVSVSVRIGQNAPWNPGAFEDGQTWEAVVSFNATIGYRETTDTLEGVLNDYFGRLEANLRPTVSKYEASIMSNRQAPFAGAFVQLKAEQIDSFSVTATLSEHTSLQVSKKRISITSMERGDFILRTRRLIHEVA